MNATTETAKKPFISVVTDCRVYDDYADAPSFVVFQFDEDDIKDIKAYREGIKSMTDNGLAPFKITTLQHNILCLDPIDANPLNELDAKSLRFLSDDVKSEWEDRFNDDEDEFSELWNLDGEHRIDLDLLNITDHSIYLTAYLKHTDVRIGSDVFYDEEFKQICKWVEELNA